MKPLAVLASSAVALASPTAHAAEKSFEGQGFDCFFQTEKQKLERLRLWYGGTQYKNDKSPQVEDASRIFILNGMPQGGAMSFYVMDKWPDKFEAQYFQRNTGNTPLSLLTVFGTNKSGEAYRAEIVHLPPNLAVGATIQPTKRLGGMCSTDVAITLAAFRANVQP